jgi:hypothetical protein
MNASAEGADPQLNEVIGTPIPGFSPVVGPNSATDGDFALFDGTTGKKLKDAGLELDTSGTLTENSDSKIPSQKAVKTYVDNHAGGGGGDVVGPSSATDGNLAVFDGTTGKLIKDGGAPGGGGSFLSANIARIDPSGNDSTGTVGDLTKPFLTVQAALNAIAALYDPNTQLPAMAVIDVGPNRFTEDLTLIVPTPGNGFPVLIFRGTANQSSIDPSDSGQAFASLTITDSDNDQFFIFLKGVLVQGGGITTDSQLTLMLDSAALAGSPVVSTSLGQLTVGSNHGTGSDVGSITGNRKVVVFGLSPSSGSTITSLNRSVDINRCGQIRQGTSLNLFSVVAHQAITVVDSLLQNVTTDSGVTLIRSKIYGTVTFTDPTQILTDDQGPYVYNYDFSRDGGSQGSIALSPSSGSQGGNLPSGFVITGAILEVITPLDSAGHTATVALSSGESAGDLQAATIVSGAPWSTTGLKALTALLKTTGSDAPAMVVAVQDLTAGKFMLHIEGYLSM